MSSTTAARSAAIGPAVPISACTRGYRTRLIMPGDIGGCRTISSYENLPGSLVGSAHRSRQHRPVPSSVTSISSRQVIGSPDACVSPSDAAHGPCRGERHSAGRRLPRRQYHLSCGFSRCLGEHGHQLSDSTPRECSTSTLSWPMYTHARSHDAISNALVQAESSGLTGNDERNCHLPHHRRAHLSRFR